MEIDISRSDEALIRQLVEDTKSTLLGVLEKNTALIIWSVLVIKDQAQPADDAVTVARHIAAKLLA